MAGAAAAGGERLSSMATGELVKYRGIIVSRRLAPYLERLDARAAAAGGRIFWTSGLRTPAQQAYLQRRYETGDPSVPYEPLPYAQSKHATGDAADGEASDASVGAIVGAYAQSLGMGWSPREPWHFEVR